MAFALAASNFDITKCAAETMVYLERHKLLDIITQLLAEIAIIRPHNPRVWIAHNIVRIADDIYKNCLKISYEGGGEKNFYQLPRRFHHRVVIYGRRGSGRKSQALRLAKQFSLVFVDAENLIQNRLVENDAKAKQLQIAFMKGDIRAKSKALCKIVSERFLKTDCLQNGWVLVNFPNNAYECKELFETFTVPPNKFVYLECTEEMAMRRAIAKPELDSPHDVTSYLELEMSYFKQHEGEMKEYLSQRHEVLFVDAAPSFEVVRTSLLGKLEKVPYVMGSKK